MAVFELGENSEGGENAVAVALGLLGDEWNLLIIRLAFLGARRYKDWHDQLGIANSVLSSPQWTHRGRRFRSGALSETTASSRVSVDRMRQRPVAGSADDLGLGGAVGEVPTSTAATNGASRMWERGVANTEVRKLQEASRREGRSRSLRTERFIREVRTEGYNETAQCDDRQRRYRSLFGNHFLDRKSMVRDRNGCGLLRGAQVH